MCITPHGGRRLVSNDTNLFLKSNNLNRNTMKVTLGKLTIELKLSWNKETEEEPYMVDVKNALLAGYKLEAIKIYKEATGMGLRESKEFVDTLCPKYFRQYPEMDELVKFQAEQFNK
jgi:ribosomal protein L7/L12